MNLGYMKRTLALIHHYGIGRAARSWYLTVIIMSSRDIGSKARLCWIYHDM